MITDRVRLVLLSVTLGLSWLTTGCGSGYDSCSPAPVTVSPDVLHPNSTAMVRSKGYPCHHSPVSGSEMALLLVASADFKDQEQLPVGSGLVTKNGSFEFLIHIPASFSTVRLTDVRPGGYLLVRGAVLPPCPRNAACAMYGKKVMIAVP